LIITPYTSTFITAALIFYSIGVWSEKYVGRLKYWQLIFFFGGLFSDTIGTSLMIETVGYGKFNFHTTSGYIGLFVMLIHTVWATIILMRKDEKAIIRFHRISIVVWSIWLVSFLSGVVMGVRSSNL